MAYRSTKARITGKIKSGGFNQPDNTLAKAIDTGAGIMSKSILKKAEEDRIEAKEEKRRAAAAARSHAAAQAKKEEAARKRERATLAIAASVGVDRENAAAINAIALDVEVFGAGAAMTKVTKDFDDGKFQIPNVDVLGPETQGPDLPSSSAVPVDGLDKPVAIDDLEATSTEMLLSQETRDSAKQQMAVTSPVSEIKPEVVGQEQGFNYDPAGKKESIDLEGLQDLAKMAPTERANLVLALSNSTDPELVATREAIELMTATKGADLSSYFTNISTKPAVEAKKLLVKNSNLSFDDKKSVLEQLDTHLGKIGELTSDLGLTEEKFYADITNEDGTVSSIEVIAKEGGGFYSYSLNKSFKPTDFVPNSILSADNVKEIRSAATTVQDKVVLPLNTRRSDVTDLLRRAASIDEIVRKSDGKVLTLVGGKIPSIIKRIATEYKNLNGFVSDVENISTEAYKIASVAEDMPSASELTELGISADEYSRFQAQAIEFAYVYARTAMGQERTTDKDFEAAFNVVVAGSDYPTFTKNLRELVNAGYTKAEEAHDLLLTHPSIEAAGMIPNAERAFGEQMVPMSKYLEGQDIQAQLDWMNTEYQAPNTENQPSGSDPVTPLSAGQQVSKIKNLDAFSVFEKSYNNPNLDPKQRTQLAAELARIQGVSTAAVEQALTKKVAD